MPTLIRILRLFAMVTWVGGLIFFAFVLAPTAFGVLASKHDAGLVVGGTLRILHIIGLVCGAIFAALTALIFRQSPKSIQGRYEAQLLLAFVMLAATAYLQFNILPAMERDRSQAGGDIEAVPQTSPARLHFEQLHTRSERVEGAVLFCGLGVVLLMARESVPLPALES